tara:strand:- start:333 stop:1175 length:843 start_codon:yes stop_codon:yes gene_type:complete
LESFIKFNINSYYFSLILVEMQKITFHSLLFITLLTFSSFNSIENSIMWGNIGHKVVGEIAERKLNPKVKLIVNDLLDGESMANASTWADEIKSDPLYKQYNPWHYVNMPLDKEYSDIQKNQSGDIVSTLKESIKILKNPESTKELKSFYLKFLIHLVGDIHQPLHTGRFEDRGGNDIKLSFLGKSTNFHIVWDVHIIEHLNMNYLELSDELINMRDVDYSLDPDNWVFETHQDVKILYSEIQNINEIDVDYINDKIPFIKHKLFKAGSTLAAVLNDIFS